MSNRIRRYGIFKCQCGNEFKARIDHVKSGHTKSCGCLSSRKGVIKHGLSKHPIFGCWSGMIQRCNNPKNAAYKYYGGRGIKICDEWKNSFEKFYAWATSNGWCKGLTIDRINNDGNYEANNCRWVTLKVNMNNMRRPGRGSVMVKKELYQ